jgi:glycosyltransferase involved in cell wall biosynthesis
VGGTEIYVNALSKALQKMGIQTVILKPGFDKINIEEYAYEGQRVIEYPELSHYDKDQITGNKPPSGLSSFRQILLEEQPDVIHFHEISGSNGITIFHFEVARELGIPIFTTLHLAGYVCKTGTLLYKNKYQCDGKIDTYKCAVCCLHNRGFRFGLSEVIASAGMLFQENKLRKNSFLPGSVTGLLSYPSYINDHYELLKNIFAYSEKVFVLSEWFRKILLLNSLPENKMVILPKALPHSVRPQKDSIPPIPGNKVIRLVYIGRISKIKGLHILLESLKLIKSNNWTLDIYGQIGEEDYARHCTKLALEKRHQIFFKGRLSPTQIIDTLRQNDVLVCPTIIREMVGFVIMEAFAAGIPVIGSDSGGIAEQITTEVNGILFKTGSSDSLSNVLQTIFERPAILNELKKNIKFPNNFNEVAGQVHKEYEMTLKESN